MRRYYNYHEDVVILLNASNVIGQRHDVDDFNYCRVECEGTRIIHHKEN